ncbi:methyltransferase [Actinomadura fibrosa]|uniref:Methyltransferase n=1 Tax=Actinomadura fibrosa TaxID=111802 RepID=A0ABW2XVZ2_9ACTN|nr:methyltransferase [Actinomadura fibrosa]
MGAGEPGTSALDLLFGHLPAQIVHTAGELGVFDRLAERPRTGAELAAAAGTDPGATVRLLRALVCLGLLREGPDGSFAAAPEASVLRGGTDGSVLPLATLFCGDKAWRTWGNLAHSVRTGDPALGLSTGKGAFEWDAEEFAVFYAGMAAHTRLLAPRLLAQVDFARFGTVVDVGGADGTLLAAVLAAHPGVGGVLFDMPVAIEAAEAVLSAAGVRDRVRPVPGDFHRSVPEGGDAYLLKNVLYDWDDEGAERILRNCRAAMGPDAVLLIIEPVLPERAEPMRDFGAVMNDISMLLNTGGRARTEAGFGELLAAAGLELDAVGACLGSAGSRILQGYRVLTCRLSTAGGGRPRDRGAVPSGAEVRFR